MIMVMVDRSMIMLYQRNSMPFLPSLEGVDTMLNLHQNLLLVMMMIMIVCVFVVDNDNDDDKSDSPLVSF